MIQECPPKKKKPGESEKLNHAEEGVEEAIALRLKKKKRRKWGQSEPYVLAKKPYILAKETYIPAKRQKKAQVGRVSLYIYIGEDGVSWGSVRLKGAQVTITLPKISFSPLGGRVETAVALRCRFTGIRGNVS